MHKARVNKGTLKFSDYKKVAAVKTKYKIANTYQYAMLSPLKVYLKESRS